MATRVREHTVERGKDLEREQLSLSAKYRVPGNGCGVAPFPAPFSAHLGGHAPLGAVVVHEHLQDLRNNLRQVDLHEKKRNSH